MTHSHKFSMALLGATLIGLSSIAGAQPTPGDGAVPVVELMPIIIKQEQTLKLSPEQVLALADYRKEAAPKRVEIQKRILALRGELRGAILDGKPGADREALMQQIADAELAHIKGRERCAEFVRETLSNDQFAQLKSLYLGGLSPVN